jgi:signal transduction histidine kinase/ActR/RegA family two-component response regulator
MSSDSSSRNNPRKVDQRTIERGGNGDGVCEAAIPESAFRRPNSIADDLQSTTETRLPSGPRELLADEGAEQSAVLSVLTGPQAGKQYRLGEETTIGRGDQVTIALSSGDVSRLHARIIRTEDGSHLLEDLDSRNGTRINGEFSKSRELQVGDRVAVGAESVLLYTKRSRVEEELLEKQKLESLGRLAGGVAHDFNNLLAVIQGNVQLVQGFLREPPPEPTMIDDCLTDVLEASHRAGDLVKQLLGFARRGRWEEAPTDLSALLREGCHLVRSSFDPKIVLETDIQPGLVTIGDRDQLYQAVMNLCLNAREAMPHGGRLTLRARAALDSRPEIQGRGPQILVEIADDGIGMDAATRQQVFEPFFTTKRSGSGAGLGLALVYGVVASHGGKVWVDSEPGRGATFYVALPAADPHAMYRLAQEATVSPSTTDEEQEILEEAKVLVVDDEPLMRRSVGRMLEQMGYQVEFAQDGQAAVARYREIGDQVAIVLMDLIMPVMSGDAALREIRAMDPKARVLVMSGHHDDATVEKLRAQGAQGFLVKPFRLEQLQAAFNLIRSSARSSS